LAATGLQWRPAPQQEQDYASDQPCRPPSRSCLRRPHTEAASCGFQILATRNSPKAGCSATRELWRCPRLMTMVSVCVVFDHTTSPTH
jgi:hypothetical protein